MKNFLNWLALIISTGFGSGRLPGYLPFFRPGGGGGMMGRVIAIGIQIPFLAYGWPMKYMLLTIVITYLLGHLTVGPAERFYLEKWGECLRHTGKKASWDFNHTNIDEIFGQLIAGLPALFIPMGFWMQLVFLILSFAIFQYLDDKKPWKIKVVEDSLSRRNKTLAIMMDDGVGGFYSGLVTGAMMMITSLAL